MTRVDEVADKIHRSGVLGDYEMRGCSEEQIASLEAGFGKALPTAYRQFLGLLGRGAGPFMSDLELFFPAVAEGNARAKRMLSWEENLELPESAFVFVTRLGEQFMFFEVDGKDSDPPIYHYIEDAEQFRHAFDSIWEFVEDEL